MPPSLQHIVLRVTSLIYVLVACDVLAVSLAREYVPLRAASMSETVEDDMERGDGEYGRASDSDAKRWAPSDIDTFKRHAEEIYKKWAPSELSLYKRDPWASSEIRVADLRKKMRSRVQRNRNTALQTRKRSDSDASDAGDLFEDRLKWYRGYREEYVSPAESSSPSSSSGVPPALLRRLASLGALRGGRLAPSHVQKRAASPHPVPVGVGGDAAARALGLFTQLLEGQQVAEQPGTKLRFIG